MAKVLLTGATGFIGSHSAELFSREQIPVKCLVRPASAVSFLQQLQVELVHGDIRQIDTILNALDDVDYVIHTAGKSTDWGRYQDFYDNNVRGTLNVVKACQSANISHLIITGSVSSYGEENCRQPKNEASPHNAHYPYFLDGIFPSAMNYYRDTKALLTQQAVAFATANQMNLTVLEPVWVYGEREFNTGFYQYVKAVQAGMKFAPGCKTNKFHVIYAGDLARAYLLAYQKRLPGINRLIIGNPAAATLQEIHALFCQSAGLRPPKLLPRSIIYPVGFIMELLATLFVRPEPPLLTRSRVNLMYDNIAFSVDKARQFLGFEAGTPLPEGINKTVAWYRQHGLL